MDDSKNNIIKAVLTLLGNVFVYLKNLLTAALGYLAKQEPKRELNKPLDKSIIGSGKGKILFFALLLLLMLTFINSIQEVQRDEIPYSQFIKLVEEAKIEKAVVTERYITGVIKSDDLKQPAKNFMTIPLWQNDLAQMMEQNKVSFVVRSSENWLSNLFFNWIIPMLILVLIW